MKLDKDCSTIDFSKKIKMDTDDNEKIHLLLRDCFIDNDAVFFGGYSTHLYSKYMSEQKQNNVKKIPDFDILSEDPDKCALIVKERLQLENVKHIKTQEIKN